MRQKALDLQSELQADFEESQFLMEELQTENSKLRDALSLSSTFLPATANQAYDLD